MTQAEQHIDTFIAAIRRRWHAQQTACWALAGLSLLLAWLLGMVLLDNRLILNRGGLLAGWLAMLIGGTVLAAYFGYRLHIRPPDADRLALMYAARVPDTHDRLINAVQFLASGLADRDPMTCAAVEENAARLHLSTAPAAVDWRTVRQASMAAGALAILLLIYAAIWPAWTANALSRVLHPFQPAAHLLVTEPVVSPGDVQLVEGQPLRIETTIRRSPQGRQAGKVSIEYRIGRFDWATSPMAAGGTDRFTHLFAGVREPLDYRVRADRSLSPTYHVRVQVRPRIETLQAVVTRPVYAGATARELKPGLGDITALAHSTVEIRLGSSLPLAHGKLAMADGTEVPLAVSGNDARQAVTRFDLARSTTYTIQLTDTTGLANFDPPRYSLVAEPDQPPIVSIPKPGRELSLPLDATVPLTIEADDDVGLSKLVLQVRTGSTDWKDARTWTVTDRTARHQVVQAELALKGWNLKVNDMLLYRAVACDNRPPEPQRRHRPDMVDHSYRGHR